MSGIISSDMSGSNTFCDMELEKCCYMMFTLYGRSNCLIITLEGNQNYLINNVKRGRTEPYQ